MARNGGVAAPDQALAAKRAILWLQALQRVRSAPDGTASARTLARLHAGPGGGSGGLAALFGNHPANLPVRPEGGIGAVQARSMQDSDAAVLMNGLDALRKRLGAANGGIYAQPS